MRLALKSKGYHKMAEIKTKENNASVTQFINAVVDPQRKKDAKLLLKLFKELTGEKPKMWGTSIVGYGSYHYTYPTGHEGDWMMTGFSPRKSFMSIYLGCYNNENNADLLDVLDPHKMGKSCLNIKRLDDIDMSVLKKLIKRDFAYMKKKYS